MPNTISITKMPDGRYVIHKDEIPFSELDFENIIDISDDHYMVNRIEKFFDIKEDDADFKSLIDEAMRV